MALKRLNMNLDENLVNEIDNMAKDWGVSRTGAISVMLSEYILQTRSMKILPVILSKIEEVQRNNN